MDFSNIINSQTRVYGLIGNEIRHSLSPIIYNYLFQKYKLNSIYFAFNIDERNFKDAVKGVNVLGTKGINITAPFKEKALHYVKNIDDKANEIGAINVIKFENGIMTGYNTDCFGILQTIKSSNINLIGKKAVVIGGGGGAMAAWSALADLGINELTLINRNIQKVKKSINNIRKRRILINVEELNTNRVNIAISKSDILIDATSVDLLEKKVLKIDFDIIRKPMLIFDLKYYPRKTILLKMADQYGINNTNGIVMLIYQAFESFKIWTGIYPDSEDFNYIMKKFESKF